MMKNQIKLTMDAEVIADFRDSYLENYEGIANCIARLETTGQDKAALIDELFRSLHTIKGNASMTQMDRLAKFAHATEEIVEAMRHELFEYTPIIGEIILLTLDKIKEVSELYFADADIDEEFLTKAELIILDIPKVNDIQRNEKAAQVITLITGQEISGLEPSIIGASAYKPALVDDKSTPQHTSSINSSTTSKEQSYVLGQFRKLSQLLESKFPYWGNRTKRILPLAQELNLALNTPENPAQLDAAVYLHDIAFAFLSDTLILKEGKFTRDELLQMQEHPQIAAEFISLVPGWKDAMQIIQQHHEKWDGSGYPKGLQENAIRPGAQILSIVDAYESMTHPRPDRQYKRSVLRAVSEINNCSGSQFSPELTPHFNDIVRNSFK